MSDMLSTGSTLVNLACTGKALGGLVQGSYVCVIGDSSAGKTVFSGTCLAEAAINPRFDSHDLHFDDVEGGALMFRKFFGPRVNARIKPLGPDGDSETVEEFYDNHHRACRKGANVTVLDSENALTTEQERKKKAKQRKAREDDTKEAGVMTDGKAKLHSQNLREALSEVRATKSILVILCQSRQNLGFGAQYEPKTRAGGTALKFYADLEIWFSIVKHLKKNVRGKDREIGIIARVKVKKNRYNGKNRTVDIPIYHSFGIDDLGSCITYLVEEKHWKKDNGVIHAKDLKLSGTKSELIAEIEEQGLQKDLRMIVQDVWQAIESECEVVRKNPYL